MQRLMIDMIWFVLYWYYIGQIGRIQKGMGRRVTAFLISLTGLLVCSICWSGMAGWIIPIVVFLLYDLFFDEEPFRFQWWRILFVGIFMMLCSGISAIPPVCFNSVILFVMYLLLAAKRGYLNWKNGCLIGLIYGELSVFLAIFLIERKSGSIVFLREEAGIILIWGVILLESLIFLLAEGTLFFYKKGFEFQTEQFFQKVLEHQYEEIRNIYMNMRGWRHDYHNHLQVMKAQVSLGNYEEMKEYLDELEENLDRVDTYVKSGNLMVDAILNSKLTLAEQKEVKVNCKALVPEQLPIDDVDLCVLLGNLLDNALEACEQIQEAKRFLRIYMVVYQSQLYISIQNSAKEDLNFNEKNYITSKRGNHGLGMKRVKIIVDKYNGYMILANEPGVFAAEVTMPLTMP